MRYVFSGFYNWYNTHEHDKIDVKQGVGSVSLAISVDSFLHHSAAHLQWIAPSNLNRLNDRAGIILQHFYQTVMCELGTQNCYCNDLLGCLLLPNKISNAMELITH